MFSGKTILIFGGGENQLTLIKSAKALGLKSVVIDPDINAPGKETADHFEMVGPKDYEQTKRIAIKYKIDGLVTGQMENPLYLMSRLAEDLNLVFPAPEVIIRCRNKFKMKQVFQENNLPCAYGILVSPLEEIKPGIIKNLCFPLIIKPIDAYSSRGVFKVNDFDELLQFEQKTRSFSSDGSILIEEFIDGKEYSVESLTYNEHTFVIQITEKMITPYPYTVELGHLQPAELSLKDKSAVESVVINAIRALEIDNCATHTELKITKNGPVLIEVGARLGGDFIASYLTLASTGVNMDEAAIGIAMGIKPVINRKCDRYSFIKYLELPAGKKIKKVNDWTYILGMPGIIYASLTVQEGGEIPPITDSSKRSGFVIVEGKSREEVIRIAEERINSLAGEVILT